MPFVWRYDPAPDDPSGFRQVAWWDWDTACVDMIIKQSAALKGVITLTKATKGRHAAYACEAMGVTPDEPLLAHELGAAIQANPEMCTKIENALHLQQTHVFHPGIWEEINPARARKVKADKAE